MVQDLSQKIDLLLLLGRRQDGNSPVQLVLSTDSDRQAYDALYNKGFVQTVRTEYDHPNNLETTHYRLTPSGQQLYKSIEDDLEEYRDYFE
ncbi:MAG: hypothetical protein AABX13_03335 [Nanoarchaeota archaeon]